MLNTSHQQSLSTKLLDAMGQKLPGSDGSACALDLGMSLMTAFFHITGTWLVIRQVLNGATEQVGEKGSALRWYMGCHRVG
jgi:hypothetical protein